MSGDQVDLDQLRAAVSRIESGAAASAPDAAHSSTAADRKTESDAVGDGESARDPYAVARSIVLRQLTNTPKTRSQLFDVLIKRGCAEEVATAVLDRFAEVGLVDDAAYARGLTQTRRARKGLSRRAIAHELRGKGIADEVAEEALGELDPAQEEEQARELVRSRLQRLHGLDREVQVRRLAGLLARKGYPSGIVSRVVFEEVDAAAKHARD